MLHSASIEAVKASTYRDQFVRPIYHDYGFAALPATIKALFGLAPPTAFLDHELGNGVKKVIALFIDGFGWRFLERHLDRSPFLKRFMDQGMVYQATSMFPSTTAAHVTHIHTGVPHTTTGIFEWYFYDPTVDNVIAPLLFSLSVDPTREGLKDKLGVQFRDVFRYPSTIYHTLTTAGVKCYTYQNIAYIDSSYSESALAGSEKYGFYTVSDALITLADRVRERPDETAYHFMYIDTIDGLGHKRGCSSRPFDAECDTILTALERLLINQLGGVKDTLLMVFADHGMTETDPKKCIYLDEDRAKVTRWLRTTRRGTPLLAGGSPQDLFLYIRPDCIAEAVEYFQGVVGEHGVVLPVQQLIDDHIFGLESPSPEFLARVGEVAVLMDGKTSAWWRAYPRPFQQYALHGGLSRAEMEIPVMLWRT